MGDEAVYGGVPLGHEGLQVVQVPVARVDAREVCKAVQARQVGHAAAGLPVVPVYRRDAQPILSEGPANCLAFPLQLLLTQGAMTWARRGSAHAHSMRTLHTGIAAAMGRVARGGCQGLYLMAASLVGFMAMVKRCDFVVVFTVIFCLTWLTAAHVSAVGSSWQPTPPQARCSVLQACI